ncbi:MAG: hypothetical protein AAGF75_05815, partial [Cyanobacteria bacterium P01_H01_bin.130]
SQVRRFDPRRYTAKAAGSITRRIAQPYTFETCVASQFEQHLRAVTDLPLAPAKMTVPAAIMVNLLGFESAEFEPDETPYGDRFEAINAIPNTKIHWYGKAASRPGRKVGHVTLWATSPEEVGTLGDRANEIEKIWYGP